ncbi:AMP-dependent synthetase, partial [Pseudomonas sp. GW531-E2]
PNEIEALVGMHPAVRHVAVIARADERWGERPVLIVETAEADVTPATLIALLRGKVADFWIPDQVAQIEAMPLAATGKIDKLRLNAELAAGTI